MTVCEIFLTYICAGYLYTRAVLKLCNFLYILFKCMFSHHKKPFFGIFSSSYPVNITILYTSPLQQIQLLTWFWKPKKNGVLPLSKWVGAPAFICLLLCNIWDVSISCDSKSIFTLPIYVTYSSSSFHLPFLCT